MNIYVVQFEEGGIPLEPMMLTDEGKAFDHYEKLVTEEGFRARNESEPFEDYQSAYWDWIGEESPDDTVRFWEYKILVGDDEIKKALEDAGYLTMGMWHIADIHGVCKDKDLPELTDEQAKEVLGWVGSKHDASIGINWEVLEYWIEEYCSDKGIK